MEPAEMAWFLAERADRPTLLHHIDPAKGILGPDLDAVADWRSRLTAAAH